MVHGMHECMKTASIIMVIVISNVTEDRPIDNCHELNHCIHMLYTSLYFCPHPTQLRLCVLVHVNTELPAGYDVMPDASTSCQPTPRVGVFPY